MPGRILETMASSPLSSDDGTTTNQRRSGRVSRRPNTFAPESTTANKRKRAQDPSVSEEDDEQLDESVNHSQNNTEDEENASDQEAHGNSASTRRTAAKPASKRAKTDRHIGNPTSRQATGAVRKTKRTARNLDRDDAENAGGLYADVYGKGKTVAGAVDDWTQQFHEHQATALMKLVNFALRCAGCRLEIDTHDIADPDACTNKLGDLQDEFQAVSLNTQSCNLRLTRLAKCYRVSNHIQDKGCDSIQGYNDRILSDPSACYA